MGWFSKKNKKENPKNYPSIARLPDLPELPKMEDDMENLPKLPSYPSNSTGKKFSDEAIKNIVSGEKIGDEEVFDADESFPRAKGMPMQKPQIQSIKKIDPGNLPKFSPRNFSGPSTKESEPVFVRMDKFEESLEIFEKSRKKLEEMEKFLSEIKHIREKEESELRDWEKEMQIIKSQFEKINKNIFSKI